jgi:hypothetical protein
MPRRNYIGKVIGRRQCPCGCLKWFDVTTRSPRKVCLDLSHAATYSAKRKGRAEEHLGRRREKFGEMLAALVVPGQPVKHAQLVDLCERVHKLGYFAGFRVGKGTSARRTKRADRAQSAKARAA